MKKIFSLFFTLCMVMTLTACSGENTSSGQNTSSAGTSNEPGDSSASSESPENRASEQSSSAAEPDSTASDPDNNASNTLVVYFSMPETTNPDNMTEDEDNSVVIINGEVLGNTQHVAYVIRENTGADIFRIEPATPYPTDHETLVDLASVEQSENARPAIAGNIENLEQYDTIFIGYPNWWGDMPMILYTFFDRYDFSGKTIIPFNTHGGSGFSDTINTIAGLEPSANVEHNGYSVSRNNVHEAEPAVISWLEGLGF